MMPLPRVMPLLPFLALALLGVAAGMSLATQAAVNATLRGSLGSASAAAFVSYLGGTLIMALVLGLSRPAGLTWAGLTAPGLGAPAWWAWSGGLLGAVYVMISILLVPRLGTATVLSLFVLGQMLASVAFDHYGLFGLPERAADPGRLLGALFVVLGVVLMRR